jgi:hypothetical protein
MFGGVLMDSQLDSLLKLLLATGPKHETGFDPDSQSPYIRLPLDADPDVFIWAYTTTGEIRIRFDGGGFIKHKLFRFIYATAHKGVSDDDSVEVIREEHNLLVMKYPRGRVTVLTAAQPLEGRLKMAIRVVLPKDDRTVEKLLSEETVKEIELRVEQIEALLKSYYEVVVDDGEEDEEDDRPRRRSNGVAHVTVS